MTYSDKSISDVRNYWDSRPCNIRHSPRPLGSVEYWNEVEQRKYRVEPHIPLFAEFEKWKDKRVLEIGCGLGTDTVNFARAGASVTAVDLSGESLRLARQRADLFGVGDNVIFRQLSAENLPTYLQQESYDLIYSFGVLHHTPHPWRAIEQLSHVASSETDLRIMLYHRYSLKTLVLTKGRVWNDELVAKQSEAEANCPITYTYSRVEAKDLLSPYFKPYSMSVDHIFPYKIPEYKNYEYVRKEWTNLPGFRALEKTAGWHLLIKARKS